MRKTNKNAYININEHQVEIVAKNKILWLVVGAFTVILVAFWLVMLRYNIEKQTKDINFSQIGSQISASLDKFDTEIKNRADAKNISADDLAAIRANLEEQIKSNPDSGAWPTHEFSDVFSAFNLSLQYPENWSNAKGIDFVILYDTKSVTSTNSYGSGKISFTKWSNAKKYDLKTWLEKTNNAIDAGYSLENPIFSNASGTPENIVFNSASTSDKILDKIIFINSASNKSVLEIKIDATGDVKYYKPLTEEIIRTIKIIK